MNLKNLLNEVVTFFSEEIIYHDEVAALNPTKIYRNFNPVDGEIEQEEDKPEAIELPEDTELANLGYTKEDLEGKSEDDIKQIKEGKIAKETEVEVEKKEEVEEVKETDLADEVIKFSDKVEVPLKKVQDLTKELISEFGERFEKLDTEMKMDLIRERVNIYVHRRNTDGKSQNLADERKDFEKQKAILEKQQDRIDKENEAIEARKVEIEARKAEIEKELKDKNKLLNQDADDIVDEDERFDVKLDQREAKKDKLKLESEKKALDKEGEEDLKEKASRLEIEATTITLDSYVNELQSKYPELVTESNPLELYVKRFNDGITDLTELEKAELPIVARLAHIIFTFRDRHSRSKISIADFYAEEKINLPALPVRQSKKSKTIDIKTAKQDELLKRIIENSKNDSPVVKGGDTRQTHQSGEGVKYLTDKEKDEKIQKLYKGFRRESYNTTT